MLTQKKLVEISRHFGASPGLQPAMEHTLAETRRMQSALLKCLTSHRRVCNACNCHCMVMPQPTLSLLSKPYRLLMCRYVFDYPPSWKVETVGKVIILQGQKIWMAYQCSVY